MKEEEEGKQETTENRINLYVRTRDYTANITKKKKKEQTVLRTKQIDLKYAERKRKRPFDHLLSRNYEYEKMK